jgi:ribosomal protein L37AE/L43A
MKKKVIVELFQPPGHHEGQLVTSEDSRVERQNESVSRCSTCEHRALSRPLWKRPASDPWSCGVHALVKQVYFHSGPLLLAAVCISGHQTSPYPHSCHPGIQFFLLSQKESEAQQKEHCPSSHQRGGRARTPSVLWCLPARPLPK